jgi:hypothetical protein
MAVKKTKRSPVKPSVKNRSLSPNQSPGQPARPFQEQDVQRRLGNFEGMGETSRKGGRTTGIVGQTRAKFTTDKSKTKSKAK